MQRPRGGEQMPRDAPEGLSPGQPWTVLSYKPVIRQQILRVGGTIHSKSAEEIPKWMRLPGAPRGGSLEPASHYLQKGLQTRPPIGQKGALRSREEQDLILTECSSEQLGKEVALNPGSLWGPHTLNEGEEEDVKEGVWSAEESVAGEGTDVESGALIKSLTAPGHPSCPADPTCPKPQHPPLPQLSPHSLSQRECSYPPKRSQSSAIPGISRLSLLPTVSL